MADSTLKVNLVAVDKASASLKKVGKGLGDVAKIAGGIALANVGADLVGFAKSSVGAFENAGKEALKLQRYLGGTIEDASRMGHALKMSGLDATQASRGMGIMSKFTSTAGAQLDQYSANQYAASQAGKVFTGKLGPAAKVMGELGIKFRDANGDVRSTQDIMLEFADAIKALPPGVDRTSYVLKAFGKSGMDLLPFLSKGSDGIRELMGESDKLGTTLKATDADAIKKSIVAKRKLGESIRGVQINLGKFLYPAMLAFTNLLSSKVVPIMGKVVGVISKVGSAFGILFSGDDAAYGFAEVMDNVFGNSGKLIPAFEAIGERILKVVGFLKDDLLPAAKSFASTLISTLVPAVVKLGGWLVKYQDWLLPIAAGVLAIVAAMKVYGVIMTVIRTATAAWAAVQAALNVVLTANPIGIIILAIVGLVAALVVAYRKSETFRNVVQTALAGVRVAFDWLKDKAVAALDWIKRNWDTIVTVLKNTPIGIYLRLVWASFKWLRDNIGGAVNWIKSKWDGFITFFTGLKDSISAVAGDIINALTYPFKVAFNLISQAWNATVGGLEFGIPDWVKYSGSPVAIALAGKSFSIPKAPTVAMEVGGRVNADGLAMLHKGEVVMPYDRAMGIERGRPTVVVNVQGSTLASKQEIARVVTDALKSSGVRGLATA